MPQIDRYLETRFLDANRNLDRAHLFRGLGYNYAELLPADRRARILDLGCGPGYFLDYLASAGYVNRFGLEISADCARASGERHQVAHVTDVRKFLTGGPEWDAIVMRHVLAHLTKTETVEFLGWVREALKPGGFLLVETFNGALPTAVFTWANDFTHHQVFTEASLRQVLLLGGFQKVEVRPVRTPVVGVKGSLYALARHLYTGWLRVKFVLERGRGNNPSLWSKFVLAVATKSE